MKRQYRNMADDQKKAISQSLKGRSLSPNHRFNLSQALKAYWATLDYSGNTEDNSINNNKGNETQSKN